jgi:hypothetical protein
MLMRTMCFEPFAVSSLPNKKPLVDPPEVFLFIANVGFRMMKFE